MPLMITGSASFRRPGLVRVGVEGESALLVSLGVLAASFPSLAPTLEHLLAEGHRQDPLREVDVRPLETDHSPGRQPVIMASHRWRIPEVVAIRV